MTPSSVVLATAILLSAVCALRFESPSSPTHPIFILQDDTDHSRLAMARLGFGIPNSNIYTFSTAKDEAHKDRTVGIAAGEYTVPRGPHKDLVCEYRALSGAQYRKNILHSISDDWNLWETKHDRYKNTKSASFHPEPTLEEKKTGVYHRPGARIDGHNIYFVVSYYAPSIKRSPASGPVTAYNGMVITSTHGNLAGELSIDGTVTPQHFAALISNLLPTPPKYLVVLSCGAGQSSSLAQTIADETKAITFVSKFIVTRSGSLPKMEWEFNNPTPTDFALVSPQYDDIGDPMPTGIELCKKLRMPFTPKDKAHWTTYAQHGPPFSYFDASLMDSDQYYFTMAIPAGSKSSFDESDCISRFPYSPPENCLSSNPNLQAACAKKRLTHRSKKTSPS